MSRSRTELLEPVNPLDIDVSLALVASASAVLGAITGDGEGVDAGETTTCRGLLRTRRLSSNHGTAAGSVGAFGGCFGTYRPDGGEFDDEEEQTATNQ